MSKYIVGGIINPMDNNTAEGLLECLRSGFKLEKVTDKSLGIIPRSATTDTQPTKDSEGFVTPSIIEMTYCGFLNHTKKASNTKLLKSFKDLTFRLQLSTIDDTTVIRFLIPA